MTSTAPNEQENKTQDLSHLDPPFIAKPSADCCLSGTLHTGTPRGSFTTIADVETYIVHPPANKSNGHILLYYADVWGMFTNGLLVMDSFADAGYLTVGLDYFQGDPVWKHRTSRTDTTTDPGFDFEAWKDKYTAYADSAVPSWIAAVKQNLGTSSTKFACVGYCFGAPYVCSSLSPCPSDGAPPVCEAGAFAHPAFLKEHHFRNLERPLMLSCAETDHTFGTESRNHAVEMLREGGKEYHLQLFSGVEHGFALRGDMSKPHEKWAKEESLTGIVRWFDYCLGRE